MKKFLSEFFRRGLVACGFGPMVLAVIYLILQRSANLESLTVNGVCMGIFSMTALAFVAGGMNAVYQYERLPLMAAILLHGAVLYISYLATYLLNGWLERGITPILVFTVIFVLGYLMIWAAVYSTTQRRTAKLNDMLKKMQKSAEDPF